MGQVPAGKIVDSAIIKVNGIGMPLARLLFNTSILSQGFFPEQE